MKYIYGILLNEDQFTSIGGATPKVGGPREAGVRLLLEQLRYMGAVQLGRGRWVLSVSRAGTPRLLVERRTR